MAFNWQVIRVLLKLSFCQGLYKQFSPRSNGTESRGVELCISSAHNRKKEGDYQSRMTTQKGMYLLKGF